MSGSQRGKCNPLAVMERLAALRTAGPRRHLPDLSPCGAAEGRPRVSLDSARAAQLVTIGGSAGSIVELIELLAPLPRALDAAVAVSIHLPPSSNFPGMLQAWTSLSVKWAERGDVLAPGTIYVAPPRHHLIVNPDQRVSLATAARLRAYEPSIDWLFESAAGSFLDRHIAVVLSGLRDDGARGVRAVLRTGGRVMCVDPAAAIHEDMPQAAIASGCVDVALPALELGAAILTALGTSAGAADAWEQPFGLAS